MIEQVISELNSRISELNIIEKLYGLCEIISDGEKTFPAEYCLNEYTQVSDFDKYNGIGYHRLNGDISIQENEDSANGCDQYVIRSYPMKFVCVIPRNTYKKNNNDAYVDSKIAENIESKITIRSNKTLIQLLSIDSLRVSPERISLNKLDILRGEYTGIDFQVNYKYAYISIDYTIELAGDISCFNLQECDD